MKISGLGSRVYIRRCLIHLPVGLAIAFVALEGAVLGVLMAFYFIIYQINEDRNIKDFAYPDIAGSIWGMFLYVTIRHIIKLVS